MTDKTTLEWTPEPWPEDPPGATPWSLTIDRPNYERARACVNALAGMEPAALADVVLFARKSADLLNSLGQRQAALALYDMLFRLDKTPVPSPSVAELCDYPHCDTPCTIVCDGPPA